MAQVTLDTLYSVTIVCRQGGQNGLNVRFFKVDGVTGLDRPEQLFADKLSALFAGDYIPLMNTTAVYRGIVLRRVEGFEFEPFFSTIGTGPGTATGDAMPTQVAGLITFRGQGRKRHNHGRMYVPFPAEGDNAPNGGVTAGYGANLGVLADRFVGSQTYACGPPAFEVTGRWYIAPLGGIGPDRVYLTSRQVKAFWGTQRRRSLLNRSDLIIV